MNIAIIGAGNIGGALGTHWARAGHALWFGVRNPGDVKFDRLRLLGRVVPVAEALAGAEVVLLSLPSAGVADLVAEHGARLAGKTVIDATNNVGGAELNSLAVLKDQAPGAVLVRAFSTLGWENFVQPHIGGVPLDLFYCAQPAARSVADQLIAEVGLRPIYLGDLETVHAVDGTARVWFALVFGQKHGRHLALKLVEE
jgi:8-hydroxy-5-deazaflavin:NADPH oxidoreductase